ncbi:MAG: lysophospholipase [Zoogloeaceae bacterium]|jgi:pimeloyl-ACP methyl ester carboxylesterase|nr:lysophospholipase [Zoogloeaceae bacterium]
MPKKALICLLTLTVVVLLTACSSWPQRKLLYFPQPKNLPTQTLTLATEAGNVLVSMREREGEKALLYFGGNAEDVSLSLAPLAADFPDHALYLLHYRGYGGSAGTPSEAALHRDALALYELAHSRHGQIDLIGRSLGSGLAVRLASQKPVTRLALVTPYDSIENVARHHYPAWLVALLLRDPYDAWRDAPKVTAPTLILQAEHDTVVPNKNTQALYATFPQGVATLKTIPGRGHNDLSTHPQYRESLQRFFNAADETETRGIAYYFGFEIERATGIPEAQMEQYGCRYTLTRKDFLVSLTEDKTATYDQTRGRFNVRAKVMFPGEAPWFISYDGLGRQEARFFIADKQKFRASLTFVGCKKSQ